MPTYIVEVDLGTETFTVEAENEEDAMTEAENMLIADIQSGVCTYTVNLND